MTSTHRNVVIATVAACVAVFIVGFTVGAALASPHGTRSPARIPYSSIVLEA